MGRPCQRFQVIPMGKTRPYAYLLLVALAALPSRAADLGVPVAGYVASPSQPELRAISGVPGSYLFSDPLPLPPGTTSVHVAPGKDFALIEMGAAGFAVLSLSGGAAAHGGALSGAVSPADWVAFSPGAQSAILFSSSAQRLQLLTGLPAAPLLARDWDVSTWPEPPRMAAVSDDGDACVFASGHSVYLAPPDGPARLLLSAGEIVSIAALPNGTDVAVADRNTASLHLLQNVTAPAPALRVLASGLAGLGTIYPSADGGSIWVARPGARALSSVEIASGAVRTFPSAVAPVRLLPLLGRDTFLITASPQRPGGVFLWDGSEGRMVLVPAARVESAQ